jgi:PAS domain S-box-containing protein
MAALDTTPELRDTLASISDAVVLTDRAGRVTFLNPPARPLTGWGDDAVGRPLADVFRLADESNRDPGSALLLGRDGGERPVEYRITPVGDSGGMAVVFRDVSRRREEDQALRLAAERFRALMEQSPLSTQIFSPDGRTLRVNAAWERLWGTRLKDVHDYNVLHDPQLEAKGIAPYIRRGFAGEALAIPAICYNPDETLPGRSRRRPPDRWVRAFICPVKDEQGRVREVILVHEDITEQLGALEALRRGEERLRLAVEATQLGTWDFDPVGGALQWSPRCRAIFGLPDGAEVTYDVFLACLHPDDRERAHEAVQRALDPQGPSAYDLVYRTVWPDGSVRWVRACGQAIFEGLGDERRAVRFLGTVHDVTEQQRAEQELREANRRKDEFLAMLAHELRNPLAPVLNAVQLLRQPGANTAVHDWARDVLERQTRHLARIVDDLLDVSRLTRGKVSLRRERLDLSRLVRDAAEDHRGALERAGLALALPRPDRPLWVEGDPTRLAQVLANLLQNAAKFTPAGGRVEVSVAAESDGRHAAVTVRDTGQGIEPALLPQLFEPLTQADRSLARTPGGLGLGLSLVKGLVELHGGTVTAASGGPGRGAEFTFRLPLAAGPAPSATQAAAPSRQVARRRVLVVEDNPDTAESLRMLVELWGHEVRVAGTGPDGVEEARRFRPDVVLCDIGLPGLDGYGVARELRRHTATAGARLVAVTGYGTDDDRRRSREAGFDLHLVKPVGPEELRYAVAAG